MDNSVDNNTFISIIVPVYNVEKYIVKCLDSIINQTYKHLEIILVDDGSTDSSGVICDEYASKDKRIKVIHKENGGLSSARNEGIKAATGNYIGFVDSDDWIEPEMYNKLYRSIKDNKADIVNCGVIREYDNGKKNIVKSPDIILNKELALKKLIENEELHDFAVNKLYKRKLWEDVQFPNDKYYEDIHTSYKLFLKAKKIICIEDNLYYYYQRTGSIVRGKFNEKQFHMLDALKEIKEILGNNSKYTEAIKKRELKVFYFILRKALLQLSYKKLKPYKKRLKELAKILYRENEYINKDPYFSTPIKMVSSLSFLPLYLLKLIINCYAKIVRL